MLQQPLAELDVSPGVVVEWSLSRKGARSESRHSTSYNQYKHYTSATEDSGSPDTPKSWIATTFELPGPPDREALAASLRNLVSRHEILRCDFDRAGSDGDLTCAVMDDEDIVLTSHEVGDIDHTTAPCDYMFSLFCSHLEQIEWPLIVFGTVERSQSTTVFVACDHLVSDGGSVPIIVRDISVAYEAESRQRAIELPDVESYVDFSERQRKEYDSVAFDDPRLASWRRFMERNDGFFPRFPLDLGIKNDLTMYPTQNRTDEILDSDSSDALEKFCRERRLRTSAALLAALGIALRDCGGPDQYRVFLPVNERGRHAGQANAMGWYVNTVPVEFSVARELRVDDIVAAADEAISEAISNAQVPFVKAWYTLAPELAELPAWPYAVNFFSYIDFRKAVGGNDPIVAAARMHVWSSTSNGICHWFHRNGSGIHVNTIRVDTREGNATERTVIGLVKRNLLGLLLEARPVSMAASRG